MAQLTVASMRPPDLPGGNAGEARVPSPPLHASMRPPDLPGGNTHRSKHPPPACQRFNEAAGFTRRKQMRDWLIQRAKRKLQ